MKKFNFIPFENWAHTTQICPHCGKRYADFPALSRRDNKTNICSECGRKEAFIDRILKTK